MIQKHLAHLTLALLTSWSANAAIVASFNDPSPSPASPDFILYTTPTGQQVLGQWSWNGPVLQPITLNIPIRNKVVTGVFLNMPLLSVGGAGTIDLTDTRGNLIVHIAFDKGFILAGNTGFGASPATGSHVTISGPGIPTFSNANFAFKFDRTSRIAANTYGIDASFTCGY
jgi:hypothetical protein